MSLDHSHAAQMNTPVPCVCRLSAPQVRVCQRLGYKNVFDPERAAMHYRLRMFRVRVGGRARGQAGLSGNGGNRR